MKRLISTNLERYWEYLSFCIRGSQQWDEFGFGASLHFNWYRNAISESGRRASTSIVHVSFLWWNVSIGVWI